MTVIAAFRSPSGRITTGPTHFHAFAESDVPSIEAISEDELLDGEGFWNGERFLSRAETLELFGFSCVEGS